MTDTSNRALENLGGLAARSPTIDSGGLTFADGSEQTGRSARQLIATFQASPANGVVVFQGLFSAAWRDYEVVFDGVLHPTPIVDFSDQMWVRLVQSGVLVNTGYVYTWNYMNTASVQGTPVGNTSAAAIVLYNGQSGAAPFGVDGSITIRNPLGTTQNKKVTGDCVGQNSATGLARYSSAGALVASPAACDGVYLSAGTIGFLAGRFRLYGIHG